MDMELVVLVDEQGQPTGVAEKLAAHHASTPLHLAFSCYVFNAKGEVLITQRAAAKKVWPGVWTNSVCGHPAPNEPIEEAIMRRLDYELGMSANDVQVILPDYTYKTPLFRDLIEHEYCPVYFARSNTLPTPNPDEVQESVWLPWQTFVEIARQDQRDKWSWWCKDQLQLLHEHPILKEYTRQGQDVTMS